MFLPAMLKHPTCTTIIAYFSLWCKLLVSTNLLCGLHGEKDKVLRERKPLWDMDTNTWASRNKLQKFTQHRGAAVRACLASVFWPVIQSYVRYLIFLDLSFVLFCSVFPTVIGGKTATFTILNKVKWKQYIIKLLAQYLAHTRDKGNFLPPPKEDLRGVSTVTLSLRGQCRMWGRD